MNTWAKGSSFAVIALLLAFGGLEAQQPSGKIPRVGYLTGTGDANDPGPFFEAFRQGLQDHGYIEGRNVLIEHRYVQGGLDRIPSIVSERSSLRWTLLCLDSYKPFVRGKIRPQPFRS